jgi:V-type H+-transporting ATPase subunit H
MSLEPPTYLGSFQSNIRARPIPWEGAVRAGNITDDQLRRIKAVDKVRKEQRRQTVESDLKGYSTLLAGGPEGKSVLESASRRTDIVQYILVLAADLLNGAEIHFVQAQTVASLFRANMLRHRLPFPSFCAC